MRRRWTSAEIKLLCDRFANEVTRTIAADLGRSEVSVSAYAAMLGLKKSPQHLATGAGRLTGKDNRGLNTRFKPQQNVWNKGAHYTAGGRSVETQFKPGQRPRNWVPIGTQVIDHDGYLKRKVRDDAPKGMTRFNWVYLHRELWEKHHGPIPRGMAVVFVNGDKTDIRIENLELVTLRELMKRNSVHNLPAPLLEVVQLRGRVVKQINRRRKASGREKHD